jgi:drug/metabolite transporter (DMT)-like permease
LQRADVSRRRHRLAVWMLMAATVVWATSFAWARESGLAVNASTGLERGAPGPMVVIAARFLLAAVLWSLLFSSARRGWNRSSVRNGLILGSPLAIGIVLQHISLDLTSEAVSAFLSSLTVVFVPLIVWLVHKRAPARLQWMSVALAVPGVYLMSDATGIGVGVGETLGLAAAVAFAAHLLLVNRIMPHECAGRMTALTFACVGLAGLAMALILFPLRGLDFDASVLTSELFIRNTILLIIGPTLFSFGVMMAYQPDVAPARAVLIYLFEPVFAAAFAWAWSGATMTTQAMIGAALILLANLVVDWWEMRNARRST